MLSPSNNWVTSPPAQTQRYFALMKDVKRAYSIHDTKLCAIVKGTASLVVRSASKQVNSCFNNKSQSCYAAQHAICMPPKAVLQNPVHTTVPSCCYEHAELYCIIDARKHVNLERFKGRPKHGINVQLRTYWTLLMVSGGYMNLLQWSWKRLMLCSLTVTVYLGIANGCEMQSPHWACSQKLLVSKTLLGICTVMVP